MYNPEVKAENMSYSDRLGVNEPAILSRLEQEDPQLINKEVMMSSLQGILKNNQPSLISESEGDILYDILTRQTEEKDEKGEKKVYVIDGKSFNRDGFYKELTGQDYRDIPMTSTMIREAIENRANQDKPCVIMIRNLDQIQDLTTRETIGRISDNNIKIVLVLNSDQEIPADGAQPILKNAFGDRGSEYYKLIHPAKRPETDLDMPYEETPVEEKTLA